MITPIIFSKNRACQLHLLLESIERNCKLFNFIYVLYTATTDEFEAGYELLKQRFPSVIFVPELDFKTSLMYLVNHSEDYVCFFVDDNVFYRPVEFSYQEVDLLFKAINLGTFSLRLGLNTLYQDIYNNVPMYFPEGLTEIELEGSKSTFMFWNWAQVSFNLNFGYPFSVDGHIFRKHDLLGIFDYEFSNPNQLEAHGNFYMNKNMAAETTSSIVNMPLNLVGSSNNNAGKYHPRSLEELNTLYLQGKIIDLDNIMKQKIIACHQELPTEFKNVT